MFICQLSKIDRFKLYKRIKAVLIYEGAYTLENIQNALNSKIEDLEGVKI